MLLMRYRYRRHAYIYIYIYIYIYLFLHTLFLPRHVLHKHDIQIQPIEFKIWICRGQVGDGRRIAGGEAGRGYAEDAHGSVYPEHRLSCTLECLRHFFRRLFGNTIKRNQLSNSKLGYTTGASRQSGAREGGGAGRDTARNADGFVRLRFGIRRS